MEKPKSLYSLKLNLLQANSLKEILLDRGFEAKEVDHASWSFRGEGLSITYYQTGALVVQGKKAAEFVELTLEPEIGFFTLPKDEEEDYIPHIGTDESGKGDFFGPLVVAACYVEKKWVDELRKLGVEDSKAITDGKVLSLAKEIGKRCPCHLVTIMPLRYNELYMQFNNLNKLLAWAHLVAIEELVKSTGPKNVLVDCFSKGQLVRSLAKQKKLDLEIEERVKAEADIAVAAASCLARAQFLLSLRRLGEKAGRPLPKGAGAEVDRTVRSFLQDNREEELARFAKLHFKTLDKAKRT